MPDAPSTPPSSLSVHVRGRVIGLYGLLLAANLGAWAWALVAFRHYPVLLGTALLAYGFGLRHAVDADHIAAIDNVTRKLMQDGQAAGGGRLLLLARPFDGGGAGLGGHRRHGHGAGHAPRVAARTWAG